MRHETILGVLGDTPLVGVLVMAPFAYIYWQSPDDWWLWVLFATLGFWGGLGHWMLILAPVTSDREPRGLVEIFQRPGAGPVTQRGYLRFLMQLCDLAGNYLAKRELRHFEDRQNLWGQLDQFTRAVHENLDPRRTAYTVVNEGRRLIECDRVSLACTTAASARSKRSATRT